MKHKVIFVDDEINILKSLKRDLVMADIQAEFFTNAQDALNYLCHHSVDIVISDMKMPGIDGVDFLQQVQKLYPKTFRVILSCSDCNDRKAKEAFESRTIEQWFDKVIGISDLLEYIKAFENNEQYFAV